MPGATPIYSFPYPCVDEPVDSADFQALGDAIDAKLLDVQADANYATGRYNTALGVGSQVIPVGVETVLTNPSAQYVTPVAGVYLADASFRVTPGGLYTTSRMRVRLNGVTVYGQTTTNNQLLTSWEVPSGAIVAAAGDTISFAFLYQGTVTASVSFSLSVRLIVRIA